MAYASIVETITHLVQATEKNPERRGVFSTGEYLAVCLVLERHDWLKESKYTMLEAVERLGEEWFAAALQVQRDGWD